MHSSKLLSVLCIFGAVVEARVFDVRRDSVSSHSSMTPLHALQLKRLPNSARSDVLRARQKSPLYSDGTTSFSTEIAVGTQTLDVIIDTGSSFPWVISNNISCFDPRTGEETAQSVCNLGPPLWADGTFDIIPNIIFNLTYLDGTSVAGPTGFEHVVIAGISIPNQQIGLALDLAWNGDGVTSGVLGLGFPDLVSTYNTSHDPPTEIQYSSVMYSIFNGYNLSEPFFSLAISRDQSRDLYGGLLTIGELPDVHNPQINASENFFDVSMEEVLSFASVYYGNNTPYAISVGGVWVEHNTDWYLTPAQYIVDSGTTLNYVPEAEAAAFNSLWGSQGWLDPVAGIYFVSCDAIAPRIAFLIGEASFSVNRVDLVVMSQNGKCVSGIQAAPPGSVNILGEVFLKNVLAVFDWGERQMHFASREYYES